MWMAFIVKYYIYLLCCKYVTAFENMEYFLPSWREAVIIPVCKPV